MLKAVFKNFRLKGVISHISFAVIATIILVLVFGIAVDLLDIFKMLLIMLFVSLYAFSINNYCDRENDKHNPVKIKKNPVATGELPEKVSIILNIFLVAASIILAYIWFPGILAFILLEIAIIGLYSFRAKNIPIADLLFHSSASLIFIVFPIFILGLDLKTLILTSVIIMAQSILTELVNQIDDYKSDKKAKTMSTTVRFGKPFSIGLYYVLTVFMSAMFLYVSYLYNVIYVAALVLFPPVQLYILRKHFR